MSDQRRRKKNYLLRGLVTVLPAVLTLFILAFVVQSVNRYVTQPVNAVIYWSLEGNALGWKVLDSMGVDPESIDYLDLEALPVELQDTARREGLLDPAFLASLEDYRSAQYGFFRSTRELGIDREELRAAVTEHISPFIGVAVSLLLILTVGYFAGGFLGKRIVASVDRALQSLPVFRSVYPYTKQFVDFFLSDSRLQFERVVALEFFNEGVWSLGLVTGQGLKSLRDKVGERMVSVFMPSSPMPMTGFTIFVDASKVVSLPISVDDAIRVVISGGVLIPPAESLEELERRFEDARGELEAEADG